MDLVHFTEMGEICKEIGGMEDLSRSDTKIIDIGAGSGRVGRSLHKFGFTNIDGVDASEGLLEHARKMGSYNELRTFYLGNGSYPFEDHREKYDMAVASGVWLAAHIPAVGVQEVVQAIRTGGLFVTAMRTIYYEHGND